MELQLRRVWAQVCAGAPESVEVALIGDGERGWRWSVANTGAVPTRVESVDVQLAVMGAAGQVRALRNGYQSWSPIGVVAVDGRHTDPAATPGALDLVRWTHHSEAGVPEDGAVRSEWFTVLADNAAGPAGPHLLVGAVAGHEHDTVLHLHPDTMRVSAVLGGVRLAPGERRELHEVVVRSGDAAALLDQWATRVGAEGAARVRAPFQVGWCSWYHYFQHIDEDSLDANLRAAADWPFDVFQLDDGFQSAVGDWLTTNESFRSSLEVVAGRISESGHRPGIWIAPFLAAPDSHVAAEHPDWLARGADGEPLIGMFNEHWGGFVSVLDTTNPEVIEHLERTAAALVGAGYTYLKLDFTYAPSFPGAFSDAGLTPAQRVRAGFDAIRRGAGDDAFLLGCGAPLANCVGVVDGMRIGPDVAPWWDPRPERWGLPGYDEVIPSTRNAWRNTLGRSFLHRRLWLNDPDCVMLRTTTTDLAPEQAEGWARGVAASGGMVLVSDDLTMLDGSARALLDEVVGIGREVDAAAAAGTAPHCPDLLATDPPTRLDGPAACLTGDPDAGVARLVRSG